MEEQKPKKKYHRHKKGKNSTAGWTPEARAAAAERMRKRRPTMPLAYSVNPNGKGKKKWGRPKNPWPQWKRDAASKREKERWQNLSPEKKQEILSRLTYGPGTGFALWTKEQFSAASRKGSTPEARAKISKGVKAAHARGAYNTPECKAAKAANGRRIWANLSKEEKDKRIANLQSYQRKKYIHSLGKKKYDQDVLSKEQERLYNLATDAMAGYGVMPDKGRTIGYYQELIKYFAPDLIDW